MRNCWCRFCALIYFTWNLLVVAFHVSVCPPSLSLSLFPSDAMGPSYEYNNNKYTSYQQFEFVARPFARC